MAGTITVSATITIVNGSHRRTIAPGSLSVVQDAIGEHAPIISVGSGAEESFDEAAIRSIETDIPQVSLESSLRHEMHQGGGAGLEWLAYEVQGVEYVVEIDMHVYRHAFSEYSELSQPVILDFPSDVWLASIMPQLLRVQQPGLNGDKYVHPDLS